MLFIIFAITLIFHILFCKLYLKSLTSPFAIYGLIWFTLLVLSQLPILKLQKLSLNAVFIFYISYFAFMLPQLYLCGKQSAAYNNFNIEVNNLFLRKVAFVCICTYAICSIVNIFAIINYFGSLEYIFTHETEVRYGAIGKQFTSKFISYLSTIGYAASGVSAYLLFFKKNSFLQRLLYILPLFFVFLSDMIVFSRMNIIFMVIIYFGTFLLKFGSLPKRRGSSIIYLILILLLFIVILLIPKYIRSGESFISSAHEYAYLKSDNIIYQAFIHLYSYAIGPIIAFGNFLDCFDGIYILGQAQFLPYYNALTKILGQNSEAYQLIYEVTNVPFETNIYTYLREAYNDFGVLGIILTPLFLSCISTLCNSLKIRNQFLKILGMQYVYLYVIFGVFYTPYCQGGPAMGMMFYFLIVMICSIKLKAKNYNSINCVFQM